MLDSEGNLVVKKDLQNFLLSDIEEDATISVTRKIFSMEIQSVETFIDAENQDDGRPIPVSTPYPRKLDQVSTVLASISPTLDDALLYDSLIDRYEMGKFKSSIGQLLAQPDSSWSTMTPRQPNPVPMMISRSTAQIY